MAEQITHDVVKEAQSMGGPSPVDDTASTTNTTAGNGEAPSGPTTLDSTSSDALPTTTKAKPADTAPADVAQPSETAGGDAAQASATATSGQAQPDATPKETKEHLANGDAGEHSTAESQHAVGDASGGSDTDISRPGSVDQAKRPEGHLRTNSVKKPASFKSVSVTKNFLAKSAVSTPIARPGEKPAPAGPTTASTLQTAKPRLVAKSGASNVPRSLKLNGAGSGPDASKVWNKNQPIPPPPPKQFTDEELQKQYGIHLATRLQADEAGKESKWADIDDDEDDWAPETVQWMDGTKSTVAAVENLPPPPEDARPAANKETLSLATKPTPSPAPASQKPSTTGGTKTILKPGALLQSSTSKPKGPNDKPTLVAKPSQAAPVKSPWAPLPPVEKVSPVQVNPAVQPPPPRYGHRESHGYDAMSALPAKEIAPDDFNRSWRDDRGNRELFNAHSGRYEQFSETRRGSTRDTFRHQPSVLQRPLQDSPAEPSAAFQTSRTSADGPAWGRRRNSSNVSGGSGRRMSFDRRAPDYPPMPMNMHRRESLSFNGIDASVPETPGHVLPPQGTPTDQPPSFAQKPSPAISHVQPVSPFGSVGSSANQEALTPGGTQPIQNLVEVQQRLLHGDLESIKLRKQREKEQEAKEEAERKERLRKKLEALGFNEEPKSKVKAESPSRAPDKSPQKEKALPAPVQSPPKPPVPTSEGEVAQYGMMKVHQPQPVKKLYPTEPPPASKPAAPKPSPSPVKAQPELQAKPVPSLHQPSAPGNNSTREENKNLSEAEQSQAQQLEVAGPQGPKPPQPPQAPWSTSVPQRPWTSTVWGPPQAKDRALGNGTFDSGYNRSQPHSGPQQIPPQAQANAASIALNLPLKPSPPQQQPQAPPSQPFAQQAMFSQAAPAPPQANAASKPGPGPIGPPADKGWGNFHAHIRRDDRDMVVKAQQDLERLGPDALRPEIRETYTDRQGKSQTTLHGKAGGIEAKTSQPSVAPELKPKDETSKAGHDGPSPPHIMNQGSHHQPSTQAGRSSRFFPRPSETAQQASSVSSKVDSPPPPETESHPAFSGDSHHPRVKMPKPPPRVRLPPTAVEPVAHAEAPVSMPPRTRVGFGAQPLASTLEWQARFNGLLGKPSPAGAPTPIARPHPPAQAAAHGKSGTLAVFASSKAPLEVRETLTSATVSLPTAATRKAPSDYDNRDIMTRISAEEALLEDREFGSLPTVKPPKVPHLAANEPAAGFPPTPRGNSRFQRPLDIFTRTMFDGETHRHADNINISIWLKEKRGTFTKSIPWKRKGGKGPGPKSKRPYTPNGTSTNGRNERPRKPSNYQGQRSDSNSSTRASSGNGWSNNRSTPPHNNHPWGRRAPSSAPVH